MIVVCPCGNRRTIQPRNNAHEIEGHCRMANHEERMKLRSSSVVRVTRTVTITAEEEFSLAV